jgi:hypothetical protein
MRRTAYLAALALVAAPAAAAQQPARIGHVWQGTLGNQPITVCFNGDASEEARGASDAHYYLDAQLVPIRLVIGEAFVLTELAGQEGDTGIVWTLEPPANGRLEGEWRQGEITRPIRLAARPVVLPEYGSACETAAFLDPLLAGGEVTAKPARFAGVAYTQLSYAGPTRAWFEDFHITTLALDPTRPGDAAINRALAAALPDGTAQHPMGQCVGLSLNSGFGGYDGNLREPILITPRWLGIRDSGSSYCGGAHPNHYVTLAVYDRISGAEADPAAWFKKGALNFYDFEAELDPKPAKRPIAGLSEPLAKALLAQWPVPDAADECGVSEMIGSTSWVIGLTREGPVFVPQFPHVMFACTEEVVLPWKAARPFLSDEGRAVRDSLR